MKEQIAMIQIGQRGQKIEDFEFDVYQDNEIKKVKFSNYEGKWLVLLFYPASSPPSDPRSWRRRPRTTINLGRAVPRFSP